MIEVTTLAITSAAVLDKFLPSIITLAITILFASFVNSLLKTKLSRIAVKLRIDETHYTFFRRLLIALILFFGIIMAGSFIPELKEISLSLFASAGIAAIIIGLAAQQTIANFLAGITLIISRPLRVGDRVQINDEYGVVEDMTLRQIVIKSWDNRRIIIPNAKVAEATIINYSLKELLIQKRIDFMISYESNIDKAKKIIEEEIKNHKDLIEIKKISEYTDKAFDIKVTAWLDSGIQLSAFFWTKDNPTAIRMAFDLLESVKKRFDKEGIEIPYPHRTIVYKTDQNKERKAG